MSRTVLWIMTAFLSLAMVALVAIQAYWIRNSIISEEKQLALQVRQVLSEISNEIIQNETVMHILDEIKPPVVQHRSSTLWNYRLDAGSAGVATVQESLRIDDEVVFYHSPDLSLRSPQVEMMDDSVLVVLGEDQSSQDTVLVSAMDPSQVRNELSRNLSDPKVFVDKIVRKMLVENEPIGERLSQTQVEILLRKKLAERGIDMDFEYAVYEEGKRPFFRSEKFNEYEEARYYRAMLYPRGVYNKTTLISLYFPDSKKHMIRSMGMMGGTSLLITLFILTLFSLALFIIFKQKRLSEMKNDFVNNMTHELKTPISTISLASQMLNDRSIPEEQKNLAHISRIIQTESRQLGFQVERVLQMAIFDHGQLKLKTQEVDLHEIIETVAQNFLLQLDRRGGKLEYLPEADESVIEGDPMHITNLVSNLIENAVKYTTRTPEIRIRTANENHHIVVSVIDNGVGISREDQKRIFEKFFRVSTGNIHTVKGFGLGLSYVKLIVEHHNGLIRLKSEPGKGSQFDIHLPLQGN